MDSLAPSEPHMPLGSSWRSMSMWLPLLVVLVVVAVVSGAAYYIAIRFCLNDRPTSSSKVKPLPPPSAVKKSFYGVNRLGDGRLIRVVQEKVGKAYFELVDYLEADRAFSLARWASLCS